jgi:hypothetical protein
MPKIQYHCITCHTPYDTEKEACECESGHRNSSDFTIVGVKYESLEGKWGLNKDIDQKVPKRVTIRFSSIREDFAIYERVWIGPKGL